MGDWTLFSNHGHVLVCLARDQQARLRDVARSVGITERAVQKIVRELQQAGFISITKHGRCNRYAIHSRKYLRHELEAGCPVGRLLDLFTGQQTQSSSKAARVVQAKSKPERPEKLTEAKAQKPQSNAPASKPEPSDTPDPADTRGQGSLF